VISARARNLLKRITESEDGEIVWGKGGGWWLDADQINGRDAWELIRACLLSCGQERGFGTEFERWVPNSEAKDAISDPAYIPLIIRAKRAQDRRSRRR
jgi:hypothetical protein